MVMLLYGSNKNKCLRLGTYVRTGMIPGTRYYSCILYEYSSTSTVNKCYCYDVLLQCYEYREN